MTHFETRSGELDELLADGTRFGTIEDWIEDQPIDGDSKAALWLMAWSEQPRAQRREIVAPEPDRVQQHAASAVHHHADSEHAPVRQNSHRPERPSALNAPQPPALEHSSACSSTTAVSNAATR
jgi:hypothetical protein